MNMAPFIFWNLAFYTIIRTQLSTIAKMGKGEYVSLEVIDKICTYFGVPVEDVIEHIPGPEEKEKATEA
ncbi:helix-turn-helix transcriptional regulator [Paenibacillus larvae]